MATCSVAVLPRLRPIAATERTHGVKQGCGSGRARCGARISHLRSGLRRKNLRVGTQHVVAAAGSGSGSGGDGSLQPRDGAASVQRTEKWGEGVSLGTALLPADTDLGRLESLLFQWGNSLTANANLPLPTPLKVDRVRGGVRLGYIRVADGAIEDLVHIDVLVNPAVGDQQAYFQATRNGRFKDQVPPGEPAIMQSLLQALRKAIQLARE